MAFEPSAMACNVRTGRCGYIDPMIYTRHDFIELVRAQPEELQSLLLALIWHISQGDPNHIAGDRLGLCGVKRNQIVAGKAIDLLDPATNIELTARYLELHGLVEFLGYELANQAVPILHLADQIQKQKPLM